MSAVSRFCEHVDQEAVASAQLRRKRNIIPDVDAAETKAYKLHFCSDLLIVHD